jgi:hypothetical protein
MPDMGSLARQARRQRERAAWKSEPVERLEPPTGVPARIWLDIIAEHSDLIHRLRNTDEAESEPLIAELVKLVNERIAEESVNADGDGDDAKAEQMEILLERYAALVEAGDSPERDEFERRAAMIVQFANGEGKSIFAKFQAEERRWRQKLPKA